MSKVQVIYVPVEFPEGVSAGEGSDFNHLVIARNGQKKPLLRGTAIAGAVRREYLSLVERTSDSSAQETMNNIFGFTDELSEEGVESRIRFSDSELELDQGTISTRTHHLKNRHTGTVVDGGLFSLESCPPGTKTILCISYSVNDEVERNVLNEIHSLLRKGILIGGNKSRGVGRMIAVKNQTTFCKYDLSSPDEYAKYLDADFGWRANGQVPESQEKLECSSSTAHPNDINLCVQFAIPRGEDILVGDGQGSEHDMEPQRVQKADGKNYWRIPGSTFRGLFKSWFTRLAARRGLTVADSFERHQREIEEKCPEHEQGNRGENHGWFFIEKSKRNSTDALETIQCPIADLFGSLAKQGRIHISDSYAEIDQELEQKRVHVAIDRLTGGAAEGMLFDNKVITGGNQSPLFDVEISIRQAESHDLDFLHDTLMAIDIGLLRIGSSKSSGRLEIRNKDDVFSQINSKREES